MFFEYEATKKNSFVNTKVLCEDINQLQCFLFTKCFCGAGYLVTTEQELKRLMYSTTFQTSD